MGIKQIKLTDITLDHMAYSDFINHISIGSRRKEFNGLKVGDKIKNIPDSFLGLYFSAAKQLKIKLGVEQNNPFMFDIIIEKIED